MVRQRLNVSLRPAVTSDRRHVYKWLAKSDVMPSMMGSPDYPDHPIPTWDEFCADYLPHYFDDSEPLSGRCFIIVAEEQDLGVVPWAVGTGSGLGICENFLAARRLEGIELEGEVLIGGADTGIANEHTVPSLSKPVASVALRSDSFKRLF